MAAWKIGLTDRRVDPAGSHVLVWSWGRVRVAHSHKGQYNKIVQTNATCDTASTTLNFVEA